MTYQPVPLVPGNIYGEEYALMKEHSHWLPYDMELEGCRFNRLHVLYSETDTSDRNRMIRNVFEHLLLLAHVKGWVEQDMYPEYEADDYNAVLDTEYISAIDTSLMLLNQVGCSLNESMSMRSRILNSLKEGRMSRNGDMPDTASVPRF